MTAIAYLGLGSNQGNREENLRQAIRRLDALTGIRVLRASSVYETEPFGYVEQAAFLNMAVSVETDLSPEQLLEAALSVERELGRIRTVRWGPRTIDIDLLLYGTSCVSLERLVIPHPGLSQRAFVLVPLRDIWEGGVLPGHNQTIDHYLSLLAEDQKGVREWGAINWEIGSDPSGS